MKWLWVVARRVAKLEACADLARENFNGGYARVLDRQSGMWVDALKHELGSDRAQRLIQLARNNYRPSETERRGWSRH